MPTPNGRTPAIEVQRVAQVFRTPEGGWFPALQDITFSVAEGEFVAIIGPSGCGKSTLLRILADVLQPTAGAVRIRGKSPAQARRDRDYSFVFQRPVLFEWRSVLGNVLLPLEIIGVDGAEREERALRLLRLVGLESFRSHAPWQLSGGMQQRVAIARALVTQPSILLLDEPFGALDELTRDAMNAELLNICETAGVTALLVTHSVPEAVLLADRVIIMGTRPGRILDTVDVDLPRPRSPAVRETDEYFHKLTEVRRKLRP